MIFQNGAVDGALADASGGISLGCQPDILTDCQRDPEEASGQNFKTRDNRPMIGISLGIRVAVGRINFPHLHIVHADVRPVREEEQVQHRVEAWAALSLDGIRR